MSALPVSVAPAAGLPRAEPIGHVSNHQPGDWQKRWSDEEKTVAEQTLQPAEQQFKSARFSPEGNIP